MTDTLHEHLLLGLNTYYAIERDLRSENSTATNELEAVLSELTRAVASIRPTTKPLEFGCASQVVHQPMTAEEVVESREIVCLMARHESGEIEMAEMGFGDCWFVLGVERRGYHGELADVFTSLVLQPDFVRKLVAHWDATRPD